MNNMSLPRLAAAALFAAVFLFAAFPPEEALAQTVSCAATPGNNCVPVVVYGGGGGGGGAATIANGADATEGSTTDAPCSVPTSGTACTVDALLKALTNLINANAVTLQLATSTNSVPVNVGAITPVVSTVAEASHVLKGSGPGNFYGAYATNLTTTAGFLLIFNATSAPADGAVTPLACVPLPASGNASINNKPGPYQVYSTGITAVVSSASTCFTKTTGVITAFISGDVQ
jgi:hypothetical protein